MMDLTGYILLSITYLLTMHLALSTTREFHFFQAISLFILGGTIGRVMDSYITGFVFAMVMHFMFWNKGEMG
jgi:lipoprotein signal peptidase